MTVSSTPPDPSAVGTPITVDDEHLQVCLSIARTNADHLRP
ncbi:MAG: hypothetical protein M0Z63_09380 [Actinomycetota bacterium]|jgi:hypothetical protein|nr:hypothetical protein [Actinomycetota bacterium]MDA8280612.1 hypothetical protein [Actinomycetota bacterium]